MASPFAFFEHGPESGSALFSAPVGVIEAWEPDEIPAAFDAMEQARANGFWLAGSTSYELGYVLEPKIAPLLPDDRRAPLLQFGVFQRPADGAPFLADAESAADAARLSDLEFAWDRDRYRAAFDPLMEKIRAGDLYQANLTMPLRLRLRGSDVGLFGALRRAQAVEHGAFVKLGGPVLMSRSPELFVEISADGRIKALPMKGTMPRGETEQTDAEHKAHLLGDIKNRAENLMIVDLLRNDLARISEVGSVRVPKLFEIETFATVHQMVTAIHSRLLPGIGLREIFEGLYPCGSITGAPKIAAMAAIRDLEDSPRDAYCGAIGWLAPDGRVNLSVTIRTLILHGDDEIVLNVGGGVVHDSTADSEYDEALWKARFATSLLKG